MTTQLFLAFDDMKERMNYARLDLQDLCSLPESFGIKFNLDAMLTRGFDLATVVNKLKPFNRPLFADLKMWNGSRTMESVVKEFVDLGIDFVNVWASADKELEKMIRATEGSKTKILGLTVLSHYDDIYCQKWFKRTVSEAVSDFSLFAIDAGCHGIIVPGTQLDAVRDLQTIKVATGVRPDCYKDDRHAQEATPAQIVQGGANWGVCGSPIFKQPTMGEKIKALQKILTELQSAT